MHARQYDLRHSPHRLDEGVIVLQEFADHGRNRVGLCGGANGLQIAARAEGAAFALDHEHADRVIALDLGAELFELLRDREVDRVERLWPVERDGGDRAVDPEQRGVV
jgi:hypothetical protein